MRLFRLPGGGRGMPAKLLATTITMCVCGVVRAIAIPRGLHTNALRGAAASGAGGIHVGAVRGLGSAASPWGAAAPSVAVETPSSMARSAAAGLRAPSGDGSLTHAYEREMRSASAADATFLKGDATVAGANDGLGEGFVRSTGHGNDADRFADAEAWARAERRRDERRDEPGGDGEGETAASDAVLRSRWRPHYSSTMCGDVTRTVESGYITVGERRNKHIFYVFVHARTHSLSRPLMTYLNGGPGCSSLFSLLRENGPCKVNKDGRSVRYNPWSWTELANMLWIDQPVGVGFSYAYPAFDDATGARVQDLNEFDVQEDMYEFLQAFVQLHKQFDAVPLYLAGESYAGHYIPAIAVRVVRGNRELEEKSARQSAVGAVEGGAGVPGPGLDAAFESRGRWVADRRLELRGVVLGNALLDWSVQMRYFDQFAAAAKAQYKVDVLNKGSTELLHGALPSCARLAARCQLHKRAITRPGYARRTCVAAETACAPMTSAVSLANRNLYDVRRTCDYHPYCYSFHDVTTYLRMPQTRLRLGLEPRAPEWEVCNLQVDTAFAADWPTDWDDALGNLLDSGLRVLNFAGDADYICNWVGSKAFTMALRWSGREAYHNAKDYVWYHPKTRRSLGEVRAAGRLTNIRVYNAGHMVAQDQPEAALLMMQTWLRDNFVVGYDELPFPGNIAG